MEAKWKLEWDYLWWKNKYPEISGSLLTQNDWNQTLVTRINQISAQIHMAAHGWVPESLIYLLSKLGVNEIPPSNSSLETPIRFDIHTVAATLVEKMIERKTATSILKETVSMLDPRAAKYIAWHLVFRRRRETY